MYQYLTKLALGIAQYVEKFKADLTFRSHALGIRLYKGIFGSSLTI
jgi:hypothetical protein